MWQRLWVGVEYFEVESGSFQLKQRSSWVLKNCLSRSATVPRCDRLPMRKEDRHRKAFLVLLLLLTLAVSLATMAMISFI